MVGDVTMVIMYDNYTHPPSRPRAQFMTLHVYSKDVLADLSNMLFISP